MGLGSGLGARKGRKSLGFACAVASLTTLGCGAATEASRAQGAPTLAGVLPRVRTGLRSLDDPTVIGARLFPLRFGAAQARGAEPGGGVRGLVGGVRFIVHSDGTVVVGSGRLPAGPWNEVDVPERLGGGILFSAGSELWRAPGWCGELRLLAVGSAPIEQVLVGLDRVYLRFGRGTLAALDPRDGNRLDLGPLPAAPWIASVSAHDAWHATAVADLRGVLFTEDAGSTWRPAPRSTEPEGHTRSSRSPAPPAPADIATRSGIGALALAVAEGWPLADGTALVARDGALTRVRLADGLVVDEEADAFPMNPARCHPFSLATPRAHGAFGYTCGEPRGPTRIYVWDASESKLVEARRFAGPRQVDAFGNGALAVRGSCEESEASTRTRSDGDPTPWCTMSAEGRWSERRVGDSAARLVVLADGTSAVLHPPVGGDLSTARIGKLDGSREISRPISFVAAPNEESRVLRLGVWLDGFEERRPGWIGGWVDLSGSVLGIEISVGGPAHVGEAIRDAGSPVVGGRWGLVWPPSRRGFETTDGGMTWKKGFLLPDALPEVIGSQERVCGAVGCLMDGWGRIGWGVEPDVRTDEPETLPRPRAQSASPLRLACEPTAPTADGATGSPSALHGAPAEPVTRFPPLWHRSGPAIPTGQVGLWADPSSEFDTQLRAIPLARAYAWGPRDEDWKGAASWQLLWTWPWATNMQARASAPAPADWLKLDAARSAMRALPGWQNGWTVVPGDDADHALLVVRGSPPLASCRVALLESGRPPAWVQLPTEPFEPVEAATRFGGRWYLATSQRPPDPPATVLWAVEGAGAHELARMPRVGSGARPRVHLGPNSDGRGLGVAVEGQPDANQNASMWLAGVDIETGEVSEPTRLASLGALGAADGAVPVCGGDEPGWVLDLPYPASIDIRIGENWGASLAGATARVRLSESRACIEGVAGSTDRGAATAPEELSRGSKTTRTGVRGPSENRASGAVGALTAVIYSANQYFPLRCIPR